MPQVRLVDHLKQAAFDIVTLLTHPPSTLVPSLRAGDPIRNALLEVATTLNQVEHIPEPDIPLPAVLQPDTPLLRVRETPPTPPPIVPSMIRPSSDIPAAPVASSHNPVSLKRLLQHSNLPKNNRFDNTGHHKYNVRSRMQQAPREHHVRAVEQLVPQ